MSKFLRGEVKNLTSPDVVKEGAKTVFGCLAYMVLVGLAGAAFLAVVAIFVKGCESV